MKKYSEKLKDPKWREKRFKILSRDDHRCTQCGQDDGKLDVHHLYYLDYKEPWEYDNDALKTLCDACHEQWHFDQNRCEGSFLRAFYQKGFAPHQLLDLASGFNKLELEASRNIITTAIELMLGDKKVRNAFLDEYFAEMLETERRHNG